MKKVVFCICFALLLAGGGVWWSKDNKAPQTASASQEQIASTNATQSSDPALAVKTIELKHGEHGVELWNLRADWGKMRREGDIMELENPHLVYNMSKNNEQLHIRSSKGEIEQHSKLIRFIDSVSAVSENNTLRSELMIYNGTRKSLVFPGGGTFSGPAAEGSAPWVEWMLDSQVINASGGVTVTWSEDPTGHDAKAPPANSP